MVINNMAELKRALHEGAVIKTISHQKPELNGLMRQVTKVQTNAVYTVILGQPTHKWSKCNGGKGSRMDFDKADHYEFGKTIKWYNLPIWAEEKHLIMEFQVL
jgi:hypothetical protein